MTNLKDIMPGESSRAEFEGMEISRTGKEATFTGQPALEMQTPARDNRVALPSAIGRVPAAGTDSAEAVARGPISLDMEEFIHKNNSYVQLSRSLLVRIRLQRPDGDTVNLLCSSEEIASRRVRLLLPCQLGLAAGSIIDMDLFLNPEREPTAIHGKVRRVSRIGNEDIVRYIVEVEFCHIPGYTSREIAIFLRTVRSANRCQLIA